MRIVTYIEDINDINALVQANVDEAIVSPMVLGRFGKFLNSEVNEVATALKKAGIRPVLEWDILMTENVFHSATKAFEHFDVSLFDAIRLQDPGAVNYVLDNFKDLKIQMILETGGHHNKESLLVWKDLIGSRLERMILSIELSSETIKQYKEELDIEIEYMGLGRILLFYTPRNLVSPLFQSDEQKNSAHQITQVPISVSASSEESPHKGFPVIENMHGTFMFNTKDHCVLEYLNELIDMNLDVLRIDLRFGHDLALLKKIKQLSLNFSEELAKEIKGLYPTTLIRGFFHNNKSDVLFKKLKNYRIQRSDDSFLGDIVEVNKKKHIGLVLRSRTNSLRIGDKIKLLTPDGKLKEMDVNVMRTSEHKDIEEAHHGQVVFLPHLSGISVKTVVYLSEKDS